MLFPGFEAFLTSNKLQSHAAMFPGAFDQANVSADFWWVTRQDNGLQNRVLTQQSVFETQKRCGVRTFAAAWE